MAKENKQNQGKQTKKAEFDSAIRYSPKPLMGYKLYPPSKANHEKSFEEIMEERQTRKLRDLNIKEIEAEMEEGTGRKDKDKKAWILDPNTKEPVEVGPEDGQLTYAQALFHSANAQGKQGDIEKMRQMVGLFNDLKGNKDDGGLKQFRVDENNLIQFDPAGGSMTLAEARSMADANRRALVPKDDSDNKLTKDLLDEKLKNRDLEQERKMEQLVGQVTNKPSALTADQNGKLTINWNANPSGAEIMAWMMSQQLENLKNNKQSLYPIDQKGNLVPLEDWLEVKRFEREEKRQDERTNALRDIGATIREHAGTALAMAQEFISFMKGEQGSNSLAGTEWEEPNSQGSQRGQGVDENTARQEAVQDFVNEFGIRRFTCPCGNQIIFTRDMVEAVCSQCGQVVKPQKEEQWTSGTSSEETTPSSSEAQSEETPSQA